MPWQKRDAQHQKEVGFIVITLPRVRAILSHIGFFESRQIQTLIYQAFLLFARGKPAHIFQPLSKPEAITAMIKISQAHVFARNNVKVLGHGEKVIMFAHGFGCDHNMWRFVAPEFHDDYRVILFDNVGAGGSDTSQFDLKKYSTLHGYAQDVIDILRAAEVEKAIFVGHSVSAMVGVLAAITAPDLFERLVLVGPSPSYINDGDYVGGFNAVDIEQMLEFLDTNYLGWSSAMAPAIMGNADRPALAGELKNNFCRTDPMIARHFARTTFLSDHRAELRQLKTPSLILQCSDDVIAPDVVGRYMHAVMAQSTFVQMRATGHCPNLSAPEETTDEIKKYLATPIQ
jgi:sigma-B regulation protein RsbQ